MEELSNTSPVERTHAGYDNREETGVGAPEGLKPAARLSQLQPEQQGSSGPQAQTSAPLMQFPFFDYQDCSTEDDKDPMTPLTPVGHVPTFPAKMHAMLLRPDLQDVVRWLPHGRSWKVLNTQEFEKRVIPMYFEFTKNKNSSFFRQAKLWGFRRMKKAGPDRDSYYHPRFLRGLPHLCKDLKRPRMLPDDTSDHEPNLGMISELHPVPENNALADDNIHLDWFLKGRSSAYATTLAHKATGSKHPTDPASRKRSHEAQIQTEEQNPSELKDHESSNDDLALSLDPFFSYMMMNLDPFFDYQDYSTEDDKDPVTPLTAVGHVPTFPAKMHAILLRTDLQDVVRWLPHGRSWKVLNSQEFEKRVIPMYFEFTKHKYSSFVRQAKLWGFRRMKREGPDRDSYYHPRFLRGLPHLCKDMKRPSTLPGGDSDDAEPDLGMISEIYPVPEYNAAPHDTIRLEWFSRGRSW
jgi:HSF-type DNA-binding